MGYPCSEVLSCRCHGSAGCCSAICAWFKFAGLFVLVIVWYASAAVVNISLQSMLSADDSPLGLLVPLVVLLVLATCSFLTDLGMLMWRIASRDRSTNRTSASHSYSRRVHCAAVMFGSDHRRSTRFACAMHTMGTVCMFIAAAQSTVVCALTIQVNCHAHAQLVWDTDGACFCSSLVSLLRRCGVCVCCQLLEPVLASIAASMLGSQAILRGRDDDNSGSNSELVTDEEPGEVSDISQHEEEHAAVFSIEPTSFSCLDALSEWLLLAIMACGVTVAMLHVRACSGAILPLLVGILSNCAFVACNLVNEQVAQERASESIEMEYAQVRRGEASSSAQENEMLPPRCRATVQSRADRSMRLRTDQHRSGVNRESQQEPQPERQAESETLLSASESYGRAINMATQFNAAAALTQSTDGAAEQLHISFTTFVLAITLLVGYLAFASCGAPSVSVLSLVSPFLSNSFLRSCVAAALLFAHTSKYLSTRLQLVPYSLLEVFKQSFIILTVDLYVSGLVQPTVLAGISLATGNMILRQWNPHTEARSDDGQSYENQRCSLSSNLLRLRSGLGVLLSVTVMAHFSFWSSTRGLAVDEPSQFCAKYTSELSSCSYLDNHNLPLWSSAAASTTFGDELSLSVFQALVPGFVKTRETADRPRLLGIGTILDDKLTRPCDVVWGSGARGWGLNPAHSSLDIRSVRGPLTLHALRTVYPSLTVPQVFGDPTLLLPTLFPELILPASQRNQDTLVVLRNRDVSHAAALRGYQLPTGSYPQVISTRLAWRDLATFIVRSKLVLSSSLSAIMVAESFGIPSRLLVFNGTAPFFKFQDYYAGTGRVFFQPANTLQEALKLGGEVGIQSWDPRPLLRAFPSDLYPQSIVEEVLRRVREPWKDHRSSVVPLARCSSWPQPSLASFFTFSPFVRHYNLSGLVPRDWILQNRQWGMQHMDNCNPSLLPAQIHADAHGEKRLEDSSDGYIISVKLSVRSMRWIHAACVEL